MARSAALCAEEEMIKNKNSNILSFHDDLNKILTLKKKENKKLDSKRVIKIQKNIHNTNNTIKLIADKISSYKNEIVNLNKKIESLKDLSPEQVLDNYLKDYHNIKMIKDLNDFTSIIKTRVSKK